MAGSYRRGTLVAESWWIVPLVSVTVALAWRRRDTIHPDWRLGRAAAATLASDHPWTLYAGNPKAQMGPLAIALTTLPHPVYTVAVAALVALFGLWLAQAAAAIHRPAVATVAAWAAAVPLPWSELAWKGHADDALVLLGAAWALRDHARGNAARALPGYAVAVAAKPTAVALLPLWAFAPGLAVAALALTAVVWLPFLAADPVALLAASRGVMAVGHGSLPALLAVPVGSPPPLWVRPVQLVSALGSTTAGVVRGAPAPLLVAGFAVRAAVDPNPAPAYAIPLVALSLLCDLRRRVPWTALGAMAAFLSSRWVLAGGPGWLRLACLAVVVAAAVAVAAGGAGRRSAAGAGSPGAPGDVRPRDVALGNVKSRSAGSLRDAEGPDQSDPGVAVVGPTRSAPPR